MDKFSVIKIDIGRDYHHLVLQPHAYASYDADAVDWGDCEVFDERAEEEAIAAAMALADWIVRSGDAARAEVWFERERGGSECSYSVDAPVPLTDRARWAEIARIAGDTELGRYYAEQAARP